MSAKLAKSMLGFADDFIEGATKGIGAGSGIKVGVNKLSSNMTKNQKKALARLGKNNAGDAAKNIARQNAYSKGMSTRASMLGQAFKNQGDNQSAEVLNRWAKQKGIRIDPSMGTQGAGGRPILNNLKGGNANPSFGVRLGDAMGAGYREAYQGAKTGGVSGAVNAFKKAHVNADGSLNKARVAGTIVTTNVASRVITGGGLYKDRNGNTNLPIPFL